MLEIETPQHRVLLTGDFDTRDSPLVKGAEPIKTDILFVEGTYGGRDHPETKVEVERFITSVAEVVKRGGTVLIPAFANGRTQDERAPEVDRCSTENPLSMPTNKAVPSVANSSASCPFNDHGVCQTALATS